ncbi:type I 3-dehydroquinate dehydratase [Kamptonema cortianum]|nr:type I 3-dehydroquinate dehydratase [Kamptonema cortianum]
MPRLVDALKFQRNSPPRIVGSVTTRAGLVRAAKASGNDCDLIEVRLDLMPKPLLTDLTALNRLLAAVPLPILATLRSTREGGQCSWPLGWRLEFFSKLLPQIALIDLELFAAANCADAIQRFAAAGKKNCSLLP